MLDIIYLTPESEALPIFQYVSFQVPFETGKIGVDVGLTIQHVILSMP